MKPKFHRIDGVYVLKTDVAKNDLNKHQLHKAYKDLSHVEKDFRMMKSDLEVRPIHIRKESRTRGHVLVVMLALILRRELEKRLKSIYLEPVHAITAMNGWTILREHLGVVSFSRAPKPNDLQQKILNALALKLPTRFNGGSKKKRRK